MELAIDTATDTASIAISHEGKVTAEVSWHAGQEHTVELIPNMISMLGQAETELSCIEAIIVSKGPGSFNGLRVGVSTAKGLAFALNIPVVGIGTLETEALPYAGSGLQIFPVQEAGRGEIATAVYKQLDGDWQQLVEEHITTVEELCRRIDSEAIFCGRFSPAGAGLYNRLKECLGEKAVIEDNAFCRARPLAELGWRRLEHGDMDDISTLQPLYLRRPAITKPKARKI